MARWLVKAFIGLYLSVLGYGLTCHMLAAGTGSHPLMYFIIWDMFCGWTAYDSRCHLVAEGESGTYYELTPAPWGELHPWGNLGRQNYDAVNNHTGIMALNVLKHTRHEPIARIFVLEECWAKKFNIPDVVWNLRYDEPKDKQSYFWLRTVLLPDGTIMENYESWLAIESGKMFTDNPRLRAEAHSSRPLFVVDRPSATRTGVGVSSIGSNFPRPAVSPVGAPNGN
jgi:hypothetical protein